MTTGKLDEKIEIDKEILFDLIRAIRDIHERTLGSSKWVWTHHLNNKNDSLYERQQDLKKCVQRLVNQLPEELMEKISGTSEDST